MEKILNKFILGDAFNYLPKIEEGSVDLVFTGIPDLKELGHKDLKKYQSFMEKALAEIGRIVKEEGFVVLCQTDRRFEGRILLKHFNILNLMVGEGFTIKDYKILAKDSIYKVNLYRLNYSHVLIFTKSGTLPMDKRKGDYLKDIWLFDFPKNKNFWPSDFTDLIISTLTEKGDLVVDPFAGRGTVLRSAKELGRQYIGMEIKEKIYNLGYFTDG